MDLRWCGGVLVAAVAALTVYGCGGEEHRAEGASASPTTTVVRGPTPVELSGLDSAVAANDAFRADFIVAGKDIHALPDAFVRTQAIGDGTLGSALDRSTIVFVGTVAVQQAEADGYVATTLRVVDHTDTPTRMDAIVVVQNGGPSQTSNGPALVQDDMSPILVPGETHLLFARPAGTTTDGKYAAPSAIAGPGTIYAVVNGILHAVGEPDDLPSELSGVTLADARAQILAARGAHPGP